MTRAGALDRACLVCGGRRFSPLYPAAGPPPAPGDRESAYRITHSGRSFIGSIERCADCGLARLPEAPPEGYYEDSVDALYLSERAQRIRNADRLLRLLPAPAPGARLLDVGCSYGFLLAAARAGGYAVQGVEPSRAACEHARCELGLEVWNGTLEAAELPAGRFDVVVLSDVIEHLSDPRRCLEEIRRLGRRDARLLILTPDVGSFMARALGTRWWALLDDHLFYFSRRTLARLVEESGFAVEKIAGYGRTFSAGYWLGKLSQYDAAAVRIALRPLAGLLRLVRLDRLPLYLNLGDQMVCVARVDPGPDA